MSLKDYILKDLNTINDPQLLHQCFEYIQIIKKAEKKTANKNKVLQFAGLLTDKQASSIANSINNNFNTIEGEW